MAKNYSNPVAIGMSEEETDRLKWYIDHLLSRGMTAEQVEFFLKANYIPNDSQIEFHATCNECDKGVVTEVLFEGPKGGGKLLKLDTKVPTPTGWTTMGELRPGDTVFSGEGKPCTVTWVSERQYDKTYDLVFSDGTVITAGASHQWVTETLNNRVQAHCYTDEFRAKKQAYKRKTDKRGHSNAHLKKTPEPLGVHTTQEIVDTLRVGKMQSANHAITTTPVYYEEKYLPVPPYTLGAWLGDGTTHTGQITNVGDEILDNIQADGYQLTKYKQKYLYNIVGLCEQLRSVGVKDSKHIPDIYLRSSYDQRLALLQGLMDTDGYADKRGHCCFTSTNQKLAEGVCLLMNSLGIKASISQSWAKLHDKITGECFDVHALTEVPLFRLKRKLDRQMSRRSNGRDIRRYIVDAVERDPVLMCCIMVDSPDHTYLVTDKFIRTHNTHACFMELVYLCNKYPMLKGLYIRKTKQSAKEIMSDISLKSLRNVPHSLQQKQIIFPNGSYIRVGGYNTSNDLMNYHGANAEIIVIDELTAIRQEAYADLIANVRSARQGWKSRMLASTNPGLVGHKWVKEHFIIPKRENRETSTRCVHSRTEDNTLLGNYKETNLTILRGQKREMWLEGNWDLQVGQAFEFSDLKHVVFGSPYYFNYNGTKHIIDDSWIRIAGVDFGTSKPFCYLAGALDPHIGRLYVYKELYATGLSTKDQARRINLLMGEDEVITVTYCDPAMKRTHDNDPNTSAIDDYASLGVYLTPGDRKRIDGKWKIDNLLATKADGIPGLIINKNCRNLIDQLATLQRDENNPEDIDTDEEDHAYDALRYMLSRYRDRSMDTVPSTEREQKPTHYQTMMELFS